MDLLFLSLYISETPLLFDMASLKLKKLFKDLIVFSRESKELFFLIFFKDSFLSSIILSKTFAIILIVILSRCSNTLPEFRCLEAFLKAFLKSFSFLKQLIQQQHLKQQTVKIR